MRIGIDASRLVESKTGVVSYIYETIKELNEIDKTNEYFLYVNNDIKLDFELNKNWKICVYKCKHNVLWLYFGLPKILKKDRIDLFWGTNTYLPKKNEQIKSILTIYDLTIEKFPEITSSKRVKILYKIFTKKACKIADKIVCISKATKNDLINLLKIEESKVKVIYCGTSKIEDIDKESEKKTMKQYNLSQYKYLLYVSTIHPRKNVDTLIKAFELLKNSQKYVDIKLVLGGRKGWQCDDVFDRIQNSKYKKDIVITGYITDKEKQVLYKNAQVFIYPSLYEGFGLPILEAMAQGNIVITTNCSSLPEVGGDAAIYLNSPKNESELAKVIEYSLNLNENERNKIIEKGYKQTKKFTWKNTAKQLLEEFNKLGE